MSRFAELIARLDAHQASGHWCGVLVEITNAVIALVQDPRAKAVVFGSPEIDRHCQRAGALGQAALPAAPDVAFDDNVVVYIATELMNNNGGHTLALRDVIHARHAARPDARHVVLVTNLHDKALELPAFTTAAGAPVQMVVAPPGDLGHKAQWLMLALRQLRPGRLMLFNHHYDSACIAAAQPGAAGETIYFHHCDHDMALGLYLPHARHVDCCNVVHERCRTQLGVADPLYWPLVAADLGTRPAERPFLADPRGLVTGSHGSAIKFLSLGRHGYFDVIQRRLRELPGRHVHLGGLPESTLADYRQTLAAADIDPARFEHVPPVGSLWAWLRDSPIDIVISSFPVQGAKGLVETMGAGMPVLMHDSPLGKLHSALDMVYAGALHWRTPDELTATLRAATPEQLQAQSRAARRHYEQWHHPRELAYAVNSAHLCAPAPPLYRAAQDTLALYWR